MNTSALDQFWSFMLDFLSFQVLVSPAVLVVIYYLGAVSIPFAAWRTVRRWRNDKPRLFGLIDIAEEQLERLSSGWRLYTLTSLLFVAMEVIWRMMFEAMIAYFQMHGALQALRAEA